MASRTRSARTRRLPGSARPAADEAARLFHALSDGTRLAILDRLRGGERCVCDLVDLLGAGQSRLSFHMKTLKDAGLVADRREGRWIHYSLDPEGLDSIHEFVAFLRSGNAPHTACCSPRAKRPAAIERSIR